VAAAIFPKDSVLQINKSVTGSGATITSGRLTVRAAPY